MCQSCTVANRIQKSGRFWEEKKKKEEEEEERDNNVESKVNGKVREAGRKKEEQE